MTTLSIEEIEVMLATSDEFDFRRNLFVTNVDWGLLNHEADVVVMSKSGYLTEIEIKRSKADLRAYFKKKHKHDDVLIKNLYFCVPTALKSECFELIKTHNYKVFGLILYDDNKRFKIHHIGNRDNFRKLTNDERYRLARLGCIRVVALKNKIIRLIKNK